MPTRTAKELFDAHQLTGRGFEIDDMDGGDLDDYYEKHIAKKEK